MRNILYFRRQFFWNGNMFIVLWDPISLDMCKSEHVVLEVDWAWLVKFNLFSKSCWFASLLRLWNICETCKNRWKQSVPHPKWLRTCMFAHRVVSWTVEQSSCISNVTIAGSQSSTRRLAMDLWMLVFDTPTGQRGIGKMLFTFHFHILPEQRYIGARIIPRRCISIKKILCVNPFTRQSKPSLKLLDSAKKIHFIANQNSYHDDKST